MKQSLSLCSKGYPTAGELLKRHASEVIVGQRNGIASTYIAQMGNTRKKNPA